MSESAKSAREAAKAKVKRLTTADPHQKVDASSWTPPEALETEAKTGPRPISRRQYRAGGKVDGHATHHAGRKPRAKGGMTVAEKLANNRPMSPADHADMKTENERLISKGMAPNPTPYSRKTHPTTIPRYKDGGKTERPRSDRMSVDDFMNRDEKMANDVRPGVKHVGGMKRGGHADATEDRKLVKSEIAKHAASCRCGKCGGGRAKRAAGGSLDGEIQGTRPTGGRLARKNGGKTGKVNVNIIVAPSKPAAPPMMPLGAGVPPPKPPMPPPAAAGAPMGPPAGAGPMPPPMGRKYGGRTYPIKNGAGGGLGRLEKAGLA